MAGIKTYGTAWGGYVLIEVDDPAAFARYQMHHVQNYAHMAQITFEPLFDLDAAFADRVREIRQIVAEPRRRLGDPGSRPGARDDAVRHPSPG